MVLMALGSHFPEVIIVKLWDRPNIYCLPPRSLMVAVGKIILSQGIGPRGGRVCLKKEQGQQAVGVLYGI